MLKETFYSCDFDCYYYCYYWMLIIIEYFLCPEPYTEFLRYMVSFNPHKIPISLKGTLRLREVQSLI